MKAWWKLTQTGRSWHTKCLSACIKRLNLDDTCVTTWPRLSKILNILQHRRRLGPQKNSHQVLQNMQNLFTKEEQILNQGITNSTECWHWENEEIYPVSLHEIEWQSSSSNCTYDHIAASHTPPLTWVADSSMVNYYSWI